jgi:hypothetical protein
MSEWRYGFESSADRDVRWPLLPLRIAFRHSFPLTRHKLFGSS